MERPDNKIVATFHSPEPFGAGISVTLGDDAAQHARVLRIGPGERVGLRDGRGSAGVGVLGRVAKRSLTIDVAEAWQIPELPPVHLLVPMGDRDRMLLLAEKAAELGLTSWRPVVWRRSRSVAGRGDGPTFVSRVRARMIAGLTQSGGGWLPEIHPSAPIPRAIAATPPGCRILLDPRAGKTLLETELSAPVAIAFGPEGGMEDDEREALQGAGFVAARLVGNVLRFETAGIAALALARTVLGEQVTEPRSK